MYQGQTRAIHGDFGARIYSAPSCHATSTRQTQKQLHVFRFYNFLQIPFQSDFQIDDFAQYILLKFLVNLFSRVMYGVHTDKQLDAR